MVVVFEKRREVGWFALSAQGTRLEGRGGTGMGEE